MAKSKPIKLTWLEAVVDHLTEFSPTNHPVVLAVSVVLVKHAKRDGTDVYPSMARMGRESGLRSWSTVRSVLDWLLAERLIEYVGNRARGLRVYRLTIPQNLNHRDPDSEIRASVTASLGSSSKDSESRSESRSDPHSSRTNTVTPVEPLEDFSKEGRGVEECLNCERIDGHDPDCAYRPFDDCNSAVADQRLAPEFDTAEARCAICDQPGGDLTCVGVSVGSGVCVGVS